MNKTKQNRTEQGDIFNQKCIKQVEWESFKMDQAGQYINFLRYIDIFTNEV